MAAPLYKQGDLVKLKVVSLLPDGTEKFHPFLIISNSNSNSIENSYIGVMMTASSVSDRYSFKCSNEMFESPLEKTGCHLRMHIIAMLTENDILKFSNRMLPIYTDNLIKEIQSRILSIG